MMVKILERLELEQGSKALQVRGNSSEREFSSHF